MIDNTPKYTFEDWHSGIVILKDASRVTTRGEKIQLVDYADFSEADAKKINEIQEVLFDKKVQILLDEHIEQFKKRYNASKLQLEYFNDELQECYNIMFRINDNTDIEHFKHWGIALEHQYIAEVRHYIERTIKNGIDDGLSFIHSPNSKHEEKNRPDFRVYAEAIWRYYNWLKGHLPVEEINKTEKDRKTIKKVKEDSYWFKVGLLFANGEMDILLQKHKTGIASNYTAIAKELGNKNYRPYISESAAGTNKGNKNIFSIPWKVQLLEEYCEKHQIAIVDSFYELKVRKREKRNT